MAEQKWFARHFDVGLTPEALPALIERLEGAPARLADAVDGVHTQLLVRRTADRWSIAEEAGHLSDLEPLWLGRVEDLVEGGGALREADLENRATWAAGHNERPIADIVADFRGRRAELVKRVGALDPHEVRATALHPRLQQPMTVADLCFFVAEHDDHHLRSIASLRTGLLQTDR